MMDTMVIKNPADDKPSDQEDLFEAVANCS